MSGDLVEYASSFPVGGRVRVGIPLAAGGAFQEWGVVCSLEQDLLGLELSRDALPDDARLELGKTVLVRLQDKEAERCCRAVLVGRAVGGCLALRLVDNVAAFEPREYFRQEVYLAVDYRVPARQDPREIRERWRQGRRDQEFAAQKPEPGEPEELTLQRDEIRSRLDRRSATLPAAANMSGGGVRFTMPDRLSPGMLVDLTLYLPQPQKALEIVGEVVNVEPVPDGDGFSTALRYRFIDESDRDRIVGFVSAEQLAQLSRLGRGTLANAKQPEQAASSSRLRILIGLLILTALTWYLSHSIIVKRQRGEKHEIERMFEESMERYLKQRR